MNQKYWVVTRRKTTLYIIADATSAWDTTSIKQRVDAIDSAKDLLAELNHLFTPRMGFTVSTLQPDNSTHMGDFKITAQ